MIRALMLIALGAGSFAAVYLLTSPSTKPPPSVAVKPPQEQTESDGDEALARRPGPSIEFELRPGADAGSDGGEPHTIRDVTPDSMTAGPRVTGTLARVAQSPQEPRDRTERLFNAIVLSAGVIKVREREIHLAGITAPAFDQMCGASGSKWPCGRLARAGLRSFLRGRAIECLMPAGADKIPDPATCTVGGDDMSEWLVAQGWAKRSGEPYEAAEKKARDAKLGLWSDKRPDGQSDEVASTTR